MEDNKITYIKTQQMYYFKCPNCNSLCQVHTTDIKCGIFRHAVYKSNNEFINPHTSEEECKRLYDSNLVYGCAMPFKFDGKTVEKCGYI
tara:strand:+ start:10277 stop:10543 length:267 start_codon:yes stop_codon:yes gene_type:complete